MPSDRTDPSLQILQHALGLDRHGKGASYRNHFVTRPGSDDWDLCQAHVDAGRMLRYDPRQLFGGGYCFIVTEAGKQWVRENSPPPPRLTRSQRRYRAYLAADTGESFGEWLRRRGGDHAE